MCFQTQTQPFHNWVEMPFPEVIVANRVSILGFKYRANAIPLLDT
jgi:hypothetical protein